MYDYKGKRIDFMIPVHEKIITEIDKLENKFNIEMEKMNILIKKLEIKCNELEEKLNNQSQGKNISI